MFESTCIANQWFCYIILSLKCLRFSFYAKDCLFYDGFRQKTHFLKCYTLIYFYFLTRSLNCLWILTWVQKPICCSRAGVLHKVYCFSRTTKKVYHEVYIFQIPLLCYKWQQLFMPLYIRYGFSNCQRCIFCCTPLQMNKISKKDPHLF